MSYINSCIGCVFWNGECELPMGSDSKEALCYEDEEHYLNTEQVEYMRSYQTAKCPFCGKVHEWLYVVYKGYIIKNQKGWHTSVKHILEFDPRTPSIESGEDL